MHFPFIRPFFSFIVWKHFSQFNSFDYYPTRMHFMFPEPLYIVFFAVIFFSCSADTFWEEVL